MNKADTVVDKKLKELEVFFSTTFGNGEKPYLKMCPSSQILLGDHTQYNEGLILSTSINKFSSVALRRRTDENINIFFDGTANKVNTTLDEITGSELPLLLGAVQTLLIKLINEKFISSGLDCFLSLDNLETFGQGVSTSLLMGLLEVINKAYNLELNEKEFLEISKGVQNIHIGKINNIAHQYTNIYARKNNILMLDIRGEDHSLLPFDNSEYKISVCDTRTLIKNPEQICNERIDECDVGVKGLRLYIWGIKTLRDVSADFLKKHYHMIPNRVYKRCEYNVDERVRVEIASEALRKKNMKLFGEQLLDSHAGLRSDYEIGSEQLDFLVDESMKINGVLGSKLIGCSASESIVSIIHKDSVNNFEKRMKSTYKKKYQKSLNVSLFDQVDSYNNL